MDILSVSLAPCLDNRGRTGERGKPFSWSCARRALNVQAPEDLVMSTADEYRERSEEYQLIQCAIPTHEKFSSDGYARCWSFCFLCCCWLDQGFWRDLLLAVAQGRRR